MNLFNPITNILDKYYILHFSNWLREFSILLFFIFFWKLYEFVKK